MTTAIDSNVLLDVYIGAGDLYSASASAMLAAFDLGDLVVCAAAYAEASARFTSQRNFENFLEDHGVRLQPFARETCFAAGQMHKQYRAKGGKRERILPDFLIGAHALLQADRLLTRDRGFYREYFPKLKIIDPTKRLK